MAGKITARIVRPYTCRVSLLVARPRWEHQVERARTRRACLLYNRQDASRLRGVSWWQPTARRTPPSTICGARWPCRARSMTWCGSSASSPGCTTYVKLATSTRRFWLGRAWTNLGCSCHWHTRAVRRGGKKTLLIIGVTVTLVLLPVMINLATGGSIAPFSSWVWPTIGALLFAAIMLGLWELRGLTSNFPDHPKNRPNALDRVDRFVRESLENSLSEKVRIALALDEQPAHVVRQSTLRVHPVDSPPRENVGSVQEAFDVLDSSMLVLGAPGAGKTTMLLELPARSLRKLVQTNNTRFRFSSTSQDGLDVRGHKSSLTGSSPRWTGSTASRRGWRMHGSPTENWRSYSTASMKSRK